MWSNIKNITGPKQTLSIVRVYNSDRQQKLTRYPLELIRFHLQQLQLQSLIHHPPNKRKKYSNRFQLKYNRSTL